MSKKKQGKKPVGLIVLMVLAAVCIAAVLLRTVPADRTPAAPKQTRPTTPRQTEPAPQTQPPTMPTEVQSIFDLGYGLQITDSGKYTGMYMEDGTNQVLSDVMMLIVQNNGEDDIQLAEITALCGGEEYHFTLTNLAVGERVVLLEQERKPAEELTAAVLDACAVFAAPMELHEDVIEVVGLDGMMNVKNISDSDISGDIYIYYKYAAQDLFYGGITFRVRVEGGLESGGLRQIQAGHYNPEGCTIVQVSIHE